MNWLYERRMATVRRARKRAKWQARVAKYGRGSTVIARGELRREMLAEREVVANIPPVEEYDRPKTRGDCLPGGINEARPCPWTACRHHLYLDVNPDTGAIQINFPDVDPADMEHSCSLDLADRGGMLLEEVGDVIRVVRERSRQLEVRALLKLRTEMDAREHAAALLRRPGQ